MNRISNRRLLPWVLGAAATGLAAASTLAPGATPAEGPGPEPVTIKLWPDGAPDEPAGFEPDGPEEELGKDGILRVKFVDDPEMVVYPAPKKSSTGACVVVLPGGGYNILAWNHEGTEVAEWLNSIGITAVVVKYRVPRRDRTKPHPWPLQDARRAMRLTRHRAAEWKVDPNRIGLMGFSAGGHLALTAGTHDGSRTYEAVDAADDVSPRPNFLMPIYAAYLGDSARPNKLKPEIRLGKDTPPTFMAVTSDDASRAVDAARVYAELHAAGVEAELHIFARGGHGYGMRDSGKPVHGWPKLCGDWLQSTGL